MSHHIQTALLLMKFSVKFFLHSTSPLNLKRAGLCAIDRCNTIGALLGRQAPYPERERADHLTSSTSNSPARVVAAC